VQVQVPVLQMIGQQAVQISCRTGNKNGSVVHISFVLIPQGAVTVYIVLKV
jgi:hypothetical protein